MGCDFCNNGKIFNRVTRTLEPCPKCKEKRQQEIKLNSVDGTEDSLCRHLGIKRSLVGLEFSMSLIMSERVRSLYETESVEKIESVLRSLSEAVSIGETIDYSVLINLGEQANYDAFVSQFLLRAYSSGMSVSPFITGSELVKRYKAYLGEAEYDGDDTYDTYLKSDIVVVFLSPICAVTTSPARATHGLMKERAMNGLATVVISSYFDSSLAFMVDWDDTPKKENATYFGVVGNNIQERYKFLAHINEESESNSINKVDKDMPSMSADAFEALIAGQSNI